MALSAAPMSLEIRYTYLNQACMNRYWFRPEGAVATTVTMAHIAEAFWNNVKSVVRAMGSTSTAVNTFDSVAGRQWDAGEAYGDFTIPSSEKAGTRGAGDDNEWLSPILAFAGRFSVGTHTTRPGQKRLPFLREGDITGYVLAPATLELFADVMDIMSHDITLGAPALATVLVPIVVRTPVLGIASVYQDITGFSVNEWVSSQVSRKARPS